MNMGITKSEIFTDRQNLIAMMAKALGHPARIAIIQYLMRQNSCTCSILVDEIGLAQPTISQHLKALKNAGLIKGSVDGVSVCYCIDFENWEIMKDLLSPLLNRDTTTFNNCC